MSEQTWQDWYDRELDGLARGAQPQPEADAPVSLRCDLRVASALAALDLSAESRQRSALRARLAALDRPAPFLLNRLPVLRLAVFALLLLLGLSLFSRPVLAAFGRWLGYAYLSQTGFIQLDQTLLLPGPLRVESGDARFTIQLGVAQAASTRLWVSAGAPRPAALLLPGGEQIALRGQAAQPDGSLLWEFGPLPQGAVQTRLLLADGLAVPLGWMPSGEVGLAPTTVLAPSSTPGSAPQQPCLQAAAELRLCVQAAQVDAQGVHILVSLSDATGAPAQPQDMLDWQMTLSGAPLIAVQPGDQLGALQLLFQPLPAAQTAVTLRVARISVSVNGQQQAFGGPFMLDFDLPAQHPAFSPTPRVIETPAHPALSSSTPQSP